MAFAASFSSALDPFWQGLGMDDDDSSLDEIASVEKRVSFSKPVLEEHQMYEMKKGWSWRRKQRKKKSRKARQGKQMVERSSSNFNHDGSSYDSDEDEALDDRDDVSLDDDTWEENESRDGESNINDRQGIWQYFVFGDDTKDFEDGSLEGYDESTIYSEETLTLNSSSNEGGQNKKIPSRPVQSKSEEIEGVEIEVSAKTGQRAGSDRDCAATEERVGATISNGEGEDSSRPSTRSQDASHREKQLAPSMLSRTCLQRKTNITVSTEEAGVQNAEDPTTTERLPSDASAHTEAVRNTTLRSKQDSSKTTDGKKKKKRWRTVRGSRSFRRAAKTDKDNVANQVLDPIPEEKGVKVKLPRTISYPVFKKDGEMAQKNNVDNEESGVAHKSCMPALFGERKARMREPIGKLLCSSSPHHLDLPPSSDSVHSDLTSQATSQATSHATSEATSVASTNVPLVRLVSDNKGAQGAVVGKAKDQSNIQQQMQLEESHFITADGPQSIYTYEYESGKAMDIRYRYCSDDPEEVLQVREDINFPMTIIVGSNEVIVKVEASTISLSDCRIRQGQWWGLDKCPLPSTPGVDLVGKIHSIDHKTSRKFKLKEGDRVISLCKWGGNSRFCRAKADQLIKVPKGVDPAEATCLAETYLSAFQALQFNQSSWARYSGQSLIGKSIMVIGGMTNVGNAVIELATALGAMDVYAVGKKRHYAKLEKLGAIPLSRKHKFWPPDIMGKIDLVVDATGDVEGDHANVTHFHALHEQGCLIFVSLRGMTDTVAKEWDVTSTLMKVDNTDDLVERTHSLEVFDNWELDLERSKHDLDYLLRLLEQEMIKPVVRDVLPLGKVATAQAMLQDKRVSGYLVCEPWIKSQSRALYL